ncbi:MAG: three-Cys-motif partner protein TcmP [Candidatus Sedimenticola sp. (ex Thyasira tokunagai)]
MTEHEFGGGWTQIKLDVLDRYLSAYTTALKDQHFKLLYIDAFAGTGKVTTKTGNILTGSAGIALNTEGFSHHLFIESDAKRCAALQQLSEDYPQHSIEIKNGDGNAVLSDFLPRLKAGWRGVCFLDPYGLQLSWETVEMIANTKAFDVWYLFPLSGVYRQAAHDFRR